MTKFFKKIDKNYLWILLIAIIIYMPFLNYYVYGHDTLYHISNVLALGNKFSVFHLMDYKVFPIIAKGFGYGSGIFYPQLSHLIAVGFFSIFKTLTSSGGVILSLKIVHFLATSLSGIFMYRFVKETIKNNQIAFLAAVFYMMMPYHLIDSFIRDAFAEILVFTFLPIIMLGINYLFQKNWRGFYLYFILGYVGLIESHLVMAVYVTIFLGISILILYKKFFHKDIVIRFLIAVVIVTCINLPFLITMMEHKLYGNYAVFQEGFMSTIEIIKDNLFGLKELLSIVVTNNNMYFQILPPCVILCILFCLKYNKIKNEENNWVLNVSLIFTFLSIFMISKSCPWGIFPKILLLIQFPWRLETLLCFGISILSACSLLLFKPENRKKVIILSLVFCGLTLGYVYNLTNFKKYDINEINISEMGTAIYEYLPMSMYQNMDYYWNRTNDVIIKNGKAKVSLIKENFPDLKFTVSGEATLEVPRIYYLGYEVKMKTENSEKIIPYYENSKGFMEFKVKEKSNIEIKYVGTKLSNISKIISIITSILFIIYLILSKVFSIVKINKTIKQN